MSNRKSMVIFCMAVLFVMFPAAAQSEGSSQDRTMQTNTMTDQQGDELEVAREAAEVLTEMTKAGEKKIPGMLLSNAKAIAVIPDVVRAAFIGGGRFGEGLMVVRNSDGEWSRTPAYIEIGGASAGLQAGVTESDLVFLFMTRQAVESMYDGKLELGGEMAAVAGPLEASGSVDLQTDAIYSYSRSSGLFAGINLKGAVITNDDSANRKVYGRDIAARELLAGDTGTVQAGSSIVQPFIQALQNLAPEMAGSQTTAMQQPQQENVTGTDSRTSRNNRGGIATGEVAREELYEQLREIEINVVQIEEHAERLESMIHAAPSFLYRSHSFELDRIRDRINDIGELVPKLQSYQQISEDQKQVIDEVSALLKAMASQTEAAIVYAEQNKTKATESIPAIYRTRVTSIAHYADHIGDLIEHANGELDFEQPNQPRRAE